MTSRRYAAEMPRAPLHLEWVTILAVGLAAGCGGDTHRRDGGVDAGRDAGAGVACRVEGTTYPDGASGVPDPTSCNTCACRGGALTGCTEIACPEPCDEGRAPGTACVACGPVDECLEVETGCFATCDAPDDCADDAAPFCDDTQGLCVPFPCG